MVRVFIVLVVLALLAWAGETYLSNHPTNSDSFWNSIGAGTPTPVPGSNPSTAATGTAGSSGAATPAPTPTFAERTKGWREDLWGVTQKVSLPLDSKDFSAKEAQDKLLTTERNMALYKPAANYQNLVQNYNRLAQAAGILQAMLADRQTYTARLQQDTAATTTTSAPKSTPSPLTMSSLQPTEGLGQSTSDTNNFFKERVLKEWGERCATYYAPTLNNLLAQAN